MSYQFIRLLELVQPFIIILNILKISTIFIFLKLIILNYFCMIKAFIKHIFERRNIGNAATKEESISSNR